MIDERQVREMLERRAETISATPTDKPKAIRRARRRLVLNATVAGLVGLVVVAGALAGLRTIQATPTPVEPATPPPSPGRVGSLAYGVDGDIYVAEWDGSNPVRIADGRPSNECGAGDWSPGEYWGEGPIWSPDGRYLAYRHTNCEVPGDARWHVVISDPEGNVVAEFPGDGWDISWSPDSTRVAVWVRLFETIGVFGVDGARQALLTMPPRWAPQGDHDPMWLPDGESLVVNDVVVPIDGSPPYHLQSDLPPDGTYSPDGSRVAYDDRRSLLVADADGSNPQVVFADRPHRGTEVFLSVIDFSPEGDRILFSRMEAINDDPSDPGSYRLLGVGSLWSVNADGSDARRLVAMTAWGDWLSPRPTR